MRTAALSLVGAIAIGATSASAQALQEDDEISIDLVPAECVEEGIMYDGALLDAFMLDNFSSYDECFSLCLAYENCTSWSYAGSASYTCELFEGPVLEYVEASYVSGPRECNNATDAPTMMPTIAPTDFPSEAPTLSPALLCGNSPTDLLFILDGSKFIAGSDFRATKDFIAEIAATYQIGDGPGDSRIAMILYDGDAELLWDFDSVEATDATAFLAALAEVSATGQNARNLGGAMSLAVELFWDTPSREAIRTAVAFTSNTPNRFSTCPAAGYPANPRGCVREAAKDLVYGPDGDFGTEDDVLLVDVRFRRGVWDSLFGSNEGYQVTVDASKLDSQFDDIVNVLCEA